MRSSAATKTGTVRSLAVHAFIFGMKLVRPVDRTESIRAVQVAGEGVLCLLCNTCGHRGKVETCNINGGMNGDMTPVLSLTFACSACGSYLVEKLLPAGRHEAWDWVKGK